MWNKTQLLIVFLSILIGLSSPAALAQEPNVKPILSTILTSSPNPISTSKHISSEEYLVEQFCSRSHEWESSQELDNNPEGNRTQIWAQPASFSTHKRRPRIALVLGGGGLRGAAHVGVLRVLEREKIPIDLIVGTSMGAIIGGLYCSGVPTEKLQSVLVRGYISSFFDAPLLLQVLKINAGLLFLQKPEGIYNGKRLARCIERHIPAERREISRFHPQFGAVTTDLVTGQTVVLTKGDLAKALQATAAVPGFRDPVAMNNSIFVDGGITCNLPAEQARQLGADFVIAVDVDEKIETKTAKSFHHNLGKIGSRVLSLMLAKIDETQKAQANLSIQPNVTGISLLSKRVSDGNRAMAAGEVAAEDALPELRLKLTLAGVELDQNDNTKFTPSSELAVNTPCNENELHN